MADWTICPSCQLKHTLRNDGLCPRCHQPVEAGAGTATATDTAGVLAAPPYPAASPHYPPPAAKKASPVKWVLIATVAIVALIGLQSIGSLSGRHLLYKFMYGLDGEPVTLASANKWYLRSDDSAHRDNADADRWLVCPEKNAHVVTIVEEVALEPDQYVDMDKLVNLVIENMRKNVKKYTVHQTDYVSRPIGGRRIHGTAEIEGLDVELYHAVFIDRRRVYQVLAFTEKKNFAEMKGELDRVIQTMRLP
jgi:hypothetical protein